MENRSPRQFVKDLLYYGLGNMLYSLVQFFSMPMVVKSIDKSQVASWNILLPTGILLAAIVTFGLDSAVVRFVKDARTEKEKKTIFSTGFFFEIGLALSLGLAMWLFAAQFQEVIKFSPEYESSWWMLAAWLPGVIIAQYFQNWFKYTFRRSLFLSLIILQSAVYLGGILWLKITGHVNLFNVMGIMVASQFAVAIIGFFYCRGLFTFSVNRKLLGQLLAYGLPFMVLAFGFNFIGSVDRYVLAGKITNADFAVYTQGFRIAAVISMVVSSFNFAFGPFLLSLLGQPQAPGIISRFHTYYLMVMCFVSLCFMALAKIIIDVLAGYDYIGGQKFMLLFVTGYIFYGMYSFAQAGIIHSRKSYLGLYTLLAGLAVVFLVDFLLVKRYAGYGTALGFMLANLIMVIVAGFFSAKYIRVRYNVLTDSILLVVILGGGLLLSNFNFSPNIYIDGGIKLAVVMIVAGSSLFTLLSATDKRYIKNFLAGKKMASTT